MARIAIVGGGLGGLPTAYELRHILPREHEITLISDRSEFTFIPSLPWVALGLTSLESIQVSLADRLTSRGINWQLGRVTKIDPDRKQLTIAKDTLDYDYLAIASGAELDLDAVPGLGPNRGYTQSVCNPRHAILAKTAWEQFLAEPSPLVVGAVPGASCFGPAYEFALLADYQLRKKGLRDCSKGVARSDRVPITFITPEPYAGHLGIGDMESAAELVTRVLGSRDIDIIENVAVQAVYPEYIELADGRKIPFGYAMLLPAFRGPRFLRECPSLSDDKGFLPVSATYNHPQYPSIYGVGVVVQIMQPEVTPIPIGVPKTGQMTEAMGMAVARNIAVELGAISGKHFTPILQATCFADFGNDGIVFLADRVLPDPATGKRRRAIAKQGRWVSWAKTSFEQYFLAKMRYGAAVPWFERLALKGLGLPLIEPIY